MQICRLKREAGFQNNDSFRAELVHGFVQGCGIIDGGKWNNRRHLALPPKKRRATDGTRAPGGRPAASFRATWGSWWVKVGTVAQRATTLTSSCGFSWLAVGVDPRQRWDYQLGVPHQLPFDCEASHPKVLYVLRTPAARRSVCPQPPNKLRSQPKPGSGTNQPKTASTSS